VASDYLVDSTNPVTSFFQSNKYDFKHVDTISSNPSAWTTYPEKYKITGYQLHVYDSATTTKRKTPNVLDVLGAIGGL